MKTHLLTREQVTLDRLKGLVLCHDILNEKRQSVLKKGQILQEEDLPLLQSLPWEELHLVEMEDRDLHEDEAGARLASAVAGEGVEVKGLAGGQWPLAARWKGILDVDVERLRQVNGIEGISVYTLYHGHIVVEGELVARAKITPFVLREEKVKEAEAIAREVGGLLRVRPFLKRQVAAIVQETLDEKNRERFRSAFHEKITWFGSLLLDIAFVPPTPEAIAGALQDLLKRGAEVIVTAGARAMDPLDPAFRALEQTGAFLEKQGVPAHPGSLFWLAFLKAVPIIGMPSCSLFSKATVFDLVLPRILSGERIGREELSELGHGGFLTRELAFRFPPYRPTKGRGELE